MKKTLLLTSLALLLSLGLYGNSPVAAQEATGAPDCPDYPELSITSPKAGATVGRKFSIQGKVANLSSASAVAVDIDNKYYVFTQNRDLDPGDFDSEYFVPETDNQGNFSFTIDLKGGNVAEESINGDLIRRSIEEGLRKIVVYVYPEYPEDYDFENCGFLDTQAEIAVTVRDDAPETVASNESSFVQREKKDVLPSATPTSTVTPTPVEAGESEGWLDNLDPVLVILIGAVAGGGATGLAEYSWIRHRRKHGVK